MYICIGAHRINVDQIKAYTYNQEGGYIFIWIDTDDYYKFLSKDYDLDILIWELDRVCNPKVLKGKLDEN